jgi:hypothetical protein
LEHDIVAPPVPELPPVPDEGGLEEVLHAPRTRPAAEANTTDFASNPIERAFMNSLVGQPADLSRKVEAPCLAQLRDDAPSAGHHAAIDVCN